MLFVYKAVKDGRESEGTIDGSSIDSAIQNLQQKGLVIVDIKPQAEKQANTFKLPFTGGVKMKDIVILSQQLSTLVSANVPILTTFRLVASETESAALGQILTAVVDDIQGGMAIATAMSKHPKAFSPFYVSLVKAAEESGKLPETFTFLAEYLERSYSLIQKARNALVYPIFVIVVFAMVMVLMMVMVIPQLTAILVESGAELPFFTKVIIGTSNFFVNYGIILLFLVLVLGIILWRYSTTQTGKIAIDRFKLSIPYVGTLYRKIYLSRIADNLNMMLESGIPVVRSLEVTADVVGSQVYGRIIAEAAETVKTGSALSEIFAYHNEFPTIMAQMTRIGEETGKLGYVLKTLSRFYAQEVVATIDLLVGLIEPVLIVVLGLGVAILLSGILLPIYTLTSAL